MPVLQCENLSVGYEKPGVAQGISFRVEKGDYLCIIGENGVGKSTLIKTVLGFLKPVSGSLKKNFSQKKLGYIPQQTVVQKDFPATVKEIVLSGCQNQMRFPFYTKAEKQKAFLCMERLGIGNLSGHSYRELSGGQQQRVLLARALCATQKMLFLDEPVSALDPVAQEEMYSLIETLHNEGITIIMISHDVEAALKYATHVLHIGESIFFGSKDEFVHKSACPDCNGQIKKIIGRTLL